MPRVFLSYSHDSPQHSERVLNFARALREHGIDVELDQFHSDEIVDWPHWCNEQISREHSDFVVCVCTAEYKRRIDGQVPPEKGRGVYWEGSLLDDDVYDDKGNRRIIPVLVDDEPEKSIVRFLRGWTHCRIRAFVLADAGYEHLLRILTGQARVKANPLGTIPVLGVAKDLTALIGREASDPERRPTQMEERVRRLRELGARVWNPALSLILSALLGFFALQDIGVLPKKFSPENQPWLGWTVIGFSVLILACIRFPAIAEWITRLTLGPVDELQINQRIFRGLAAYQEGEAAIFHGRSLERDETLRLLNEVACVIVEGESGCGKSSLLNTVVLPVIRQQRPVFLCRPGDDPFGKIGAAIRGTEYERTQVPLGVDAWWQALEAAPGKPAATPLLFIDQFEELFALVAEGERTLLFDALREGIRRRKFRLLIAIRSDFADLLARAVRRTDPERLSLGAAEYLEIEPFTQSRAVKVMDLMLAPLCRDNPALQGQLEEFVRVVVVDLLRPPRDRRRSRLDEKSVLPVELQTIGMILEQHGPEAFSGDAFRNMGGKLGLYRAFLDRAKRQVWRRSLVSEDQALLVLRALISSSRTKVARTAAEVANSVGLREPQAVEVLAEFARMFLVRPLPSEEGATGSPRFDLLHEHLIQILVEAPEPALQAARDAEERLRFWTRRAAGAWDTPAARDSGWRRSVANLRRWFRVRLPLGETLALWRHAPRGSDARVLLQRNARAFLLRGFFPALVLLAWWGYTLTDYYQINRLIADAHPEQADAVQEGRLALEWDLALFKAGQVEPLKSDARRVQRAGIMWNEYKPEPIGLAAMAAGKKHDEAGVREMVRLASPYYAAPTGLIFIWTVSRARIALFCAVALKAIGDEAGAQEVLNTTFTNDWSKGHVAASTLPAITEMLRQCRLDAHIPKVLEAVTALPEDPTADKRDPFELKLVAAGEYARLGQTTRSAEILNAVLEVQNLPSLRPDAIIAAVRSFDASGDHSSALRVLAKTAPDAKVDSGANFFEADPIDPHIALAGALHEHGDDKTALKLLDGIRNPPKPTETLQSRFALVKLYKTLDPQKGAELETRAHKILASRVQQAQANAPFAADISESDSGPARRAHLFTDAAAVVIDLGRREAAISLLQAAEKAVDEIDEPTADSPEMLDTGSGKSPLCEIAGGYARLHLFRKARQVTWKCQPSDRLRASAAVLIEYAKARGLSDKYQFGLPLDERLGPPPVGP